MSPPVRSPDRSGTLPSSRGRLGGRGRPEASAAFTPHSIWIASGRASLAVAMTESGQSLRRAGMRRPFSPGTYDRKINMRRRRVMFNAHMVNVRTSCVPRAQIAESFLVFARILLFKNPVKYAGIFAINQYSAPGRQDRRADIWQLSIPSQQHRHLTLTQDTSAKLLQNRRTPVEPSRTSPRSSQEG